MAGEAWAIDGIAAITAAAIRLRTGVVLVDLFIVQSPCEVHNDMIVFTSSKILFWYLSKQ
jgi:hypothetical protein